MEVDHIFIFSNVQGKEADELVEFGFVEGTNRTHKGQGTTNRKFYFDNFFLEVLWVVNEKEINQSPTLETQLGQRARFAQNGFSRIGLCLVNTEETDKLFEGAKIYQPNYFPPNMAIDVLSNSEHPTLPWTFRLPFRGGKKAADEPKNHLNQIGRLTKVEFGINNYDKASDYVSNFAREENILFTLRPTMNLTLEFDQKRQDKEYINEGLNLVIKY